MINSIIFKGRITATAFVIKLVDYMLYNAAKSKDRKASIDIDTICKLYNDNPRHASDTVKYIMTNASSFNVKLLEDNTITTITTILNMSFSNGTFSLEVNERLVPYIEKMVSVTDPGFTFKYSYQLFSFLLNKSKENDEKAFVVSVYELENSLGLIPFPTADLDLLSNDIYLEVAKQDLSGSYKRFNNFNSKILLPAIKEINDKTDYIVRCNQIKDGVSITSLEFAIYKKLSPANRRILAYATKYAEKYSDLLARSMPQFSKEEIDLLLNKSKYNTNKVLDAYLEYIVESPKDKMSFMIERINT